MWWRRLPQLYAGRTNIRRRGVAADVCPSGGVQPVAPPPSLNGGQTPVGGRLIAWAIHPVTPTGPVAVSWRQIAGEHFAATPKGKNPALRETPGFYRDRKADAGFNERQSWFFSRRPANVAPRMTQGGDGVIPRPPSGCRFEPARLRPRFSDDKITDLDRKVFGGKARLWGEP